MRERSKKQNGTSAPAAARKPNGAALSPDQTETIEKVATDDSAMKIANEKNGKDQSKGHEFVLKTAQDRNVKFIRLWFTDILGMLKSTAIIADELETSLEEGITFDGSAIEGFAREDESDM